MLGEEDGKEESPKLNIAGATAGTSVVIPKHVDESRRGNAAEPSEEGKGVKPGTDGISTPWRRSAHLNTNLHGVGTELDPVVDEKGDGSQWPYDREERQVAELNNHLAKIGRDIVYFELRLFTNTLKESGVFRWVVGNSRRCGSTVLGSSVGLHLLVLVKSTTLEVWNDKFHAQIDHLGSDGKVDDLLAEAIGVDAPASALCFEMKLLLVLGKRSNSDMENIKVGHNDFAKRHIDECSQKDTEVRHDEVHNKDLLGQGFLVRGMCLVVLELSQSCSRFSQKGVEDRIDSGQDTSRNEDLGRFSMVRSGTSVVVLTRTLLSGPS